MRRRFGPKLLVPRASAPKVPLFEWPVIFEWAGFILRAVPRHRVLGASVFGVTVLLAVLAAAFLPRKYVASTKLLARPTNFMAALTNPNGWQWDDAPTRAARERVLARDSLKKIAQDVNLVREWQRRRNPVLKMKDQLLQLVDEPWTPDVWSDIVVGVLEKRLLVSANDETVEIAVEWPDPDMARRIVETASRNFMETRHVTEVAAISETIDILELHASQTNDLIDQAMANLRRVVNERVQSDQRARARAAAADDTRVRPRKVTSQELAQLKFMLRNKQQALAAALDQRARALAEARARLDQQMMLFNRAHPAITELERQVKVLERDTPQLTQLRRDVIDLERDVEEKGGKPTEGTAPKPQVAAQTTGLVSEASLANLPPELERDPAISVAQDQVRVALARHQELLLRVEVAHLSLDTARAAFKYRFQPVKPAQTPREALSPNVPLILIAGVFVGLVLAVFIAAGLDLWRRTLCEPWQVRRLLKVPVLVELKGRP